MEFQTSVFGEMSSPETVTVVDAQGNLCAVTWQDKQKILRVEIERQEIIFFQMILPVDRQIKQRQI